MADTLTQAEQDRLDAETFRRLLAHLDENRDVQNIDLMILAGFCRNCLGKWYKAAADKAGIEISEMAARDHIYGMPYEEWKSAHQIPATQAQLTAFAGRQAARED